MDIPVMEGITAQMKQTARLRTRVLFSGDDEDTPVVFVHGNLSSATYWEETMLALPDGYRGIAPDLRGYGAADPAAKIDATHGMGDLSDDVAALMDELDITQAHFVAHSFGGNVLWRFMMDHPQRVLSVTMVAPGSPYGFGGCKGENGELCFPDAAGSGAGLTNPELVKRIAAGDRSTENPSSPRSVMNNFIWKPPFKPAREEELLSALMSVHIGEKDYPGDVVPTENWPGMAPGVFGPNNAISPKYAEPLKRLLRIDPKPPILWIRGADDPIVSDHALSDPGMLGKMGAIPDYPGEEVFPPQPMIAQTRAALQQYAAQGGHIQELVIDDCGHSPYIERPEQFNAAFRQFIRS